MRNFTVDLIKSVCIFVCVLICSSLTGCITVSSTFKFQQEPEEVVSMRIYYEDIELTEDELLKCEPVCEIEQERYAEIMEKIEGYTFKSAMLLIAPAPSPSFGYYNYILYVEYADGGKSILDRRTRVNYDSEGEIIDCNYYDVNVEYDELLEQLAGGQPKE